ncbi:MAG: hypothetical protein KGQ66_00505 [Acidobacteriota bacterium]|nr:hypothetical protein [Acidobacteriota bacterium]
MAEGSYIRGGGGVTLDTRLVGLVVLIGLAVGLAAATVWQAAATASDRSSAARLQHAGVPVSITVTGCSGVSSGIGMAIEYYSCEGTYRLQGESITGLIHASRDQLAAGTVIPGRVVPSDPNSLTRTGPGSTSAAGPTGGSYVSAFVLGVLTLISAGLALWLWRARSRRRRPDRAASA